MLAQHRGPLSKHSSTVSLWTLLCLETLCHLSHIDSAQNIATTAHTQDHVVESIPYPGYTCCSEQVMENGCNRRSASSQYVLHAAPLRGPPEVHLVKLAGGVVLHVETSIAYHRGALKPQR